MNAAVLDSDWEAEFARVAEAHPRVLAYVKNQGMQFEVPYRDGATPRRYRPDYIVRLDDGQDDPLSVVIEIKGYRRGDAQLKAETMRKLWVPGVNELPDHVAIVRETANAPAHDEFAVIDDDPENTVRQARALRQQMRGLARQASLDPADGLQL